MRNLPSAFAALAPYRQFILYQLVPDHTRPGKTHKYPVNPQTGEKCDAHDRRFWMDADTALAWAAHRGEGYGVGFTFTEQDPFYFFDIDNCLQADGAWSPIALELCAKFSGAAVEVSQSGRGLHIIGTQGVELPAERRMKAKTAGFDLYTELRFVALTGTGAVGDAGAVHGQALLDVVAQYLQVDPAERLAGWTSEPREDWHGPSDDEALISRALRSQSAASAFGGKASFADLWLADAAALAAAYPSDQGHSYDASSADMALAQHLAFWTGCNCERMRALMLTSGLHREKWDRRDEYLSDTILKACARQKDVLRDSPAAPPVALEVSVSDSQAPRCQPVEGSTFLSAEQQLAFFAGCVYVSDAHRVLVPGGQLLKPDQFRATYGGYTFAMDTRNERTSRNAWEAFVESQAFRAPRADSSTFRPELPPGQLAQEAGRTLVNTWWPVDVPRIKGDATPFLTHLAKVLPDQRDQAILLSYMAACVQHAGVKFQWAPLLQGAEGNGKTLFSRCVAMAVGRRYVHWPKASQITTEFNAWLVGKVFIAVEDVYVPEHKADVMEELKPMITGGDGYEIQAKGVDQVSADICANFMLNSNHRAALRKSRNDRRLAVFFCAQQSADDLARDGMSGEYFPDLYRWLRNGGYAVVAELLHTYPIPEEYNPATLCHRAPVTSTTHEAIAASQGRIEQEIEEAIGQGLPGFKGGWVSSAALSRLLESQHAAAKCPQNKRHELLTGMGYVLHPGLPGGRVNNIVVPDATKPRLYVKPDHSSLLLRSAAEIAKAYSDAQV